MNAFDEFYRFAATDMAAGVGDIHITLPSQQCNIHTEIVEVSSSIISSDLCWDGETATQPFCPVGKSARGTKK